MALANVRLRMVVGVVVALALVAACGDDDGELSAQERYCAAGEELEASVEALIDLDVIAGGTDGVREAVGDVRNDLEGLRDAAGDAAQEELDALSDAVDDAEAAISDLGDEVSVDNVAALGSAFADVGSAASAVYETLSDCS